MLAFFTPVFLFAQNVGIGTEVPREKLEVNGIIFTSQGGVKFPDGTIQTTAYMPPPGMMQMGLTGLVIEFESTANIIGPANDVMINNGINVLSVEEGVTVNASIVNGTPQPGAPSFAEININRNADLNSARLRRLIFTGQPIPHIEVFYMRLVGQLYFIDHIARYENCILSTLESASSGDSPREDFTFIFEKVCYRSYDRHPETGAELSRSEACFDQRTNNPNCNCSF